MHRGTMEHPVAPWSTTMRRVFHPETNGVKASPHQHKRVLSHGAPADPSDPWNIHAAPVSLQPTGVPEDSTTSRQNCPAIASVFQNLGELGHGVPSALDRFADSSDISRGSRGATTGPTCNGHEPRHRILRREVA